MAKVSLEAPDKPEFLHTKERKNLLLTGDKAYRPVLEGQCPSAEVMDRGNFPGVPQYSGLSEHFRGLNKAHRWIGSTGSKDSAIFNNIKIHN